MRVSMRVLADMVQVRMLVVVVVVRVVRVVRRMVMGVDVHPCGECENEGLIWRMKRYRYGLGGKSGRRKKRKSGK